MEKAWESMEEVFEVEKAVIAVSDNITSQTGVAALLHTVLVLMLFWCRTRGSQRLVLFLSLFECVVWKLKAADSRFNSELLVCEV